jgi:hypothetical protein
MDVSLTEISSSAPRRVGLILIGGAHHILHLVPVAAALDGIEGIHPIIFVTNEDEASQCRAVLTGLGLNDPDIRLMRSHPLVRTVSKKLSYLFAERRVFRDLNALVVVERTSTILRHLPGRLPPFIHIPHGAGDRAKSYDPRIRHFDHVLVAGEKDRNRMIALDLVAAPNCTVTGYIKPQAVRALQPDLPTLFEDDKPVVLYTPHFDPTLSSWPMFGQEMLDAFVANPSFNYIVAPHMRLFREADAAARTPIEAYGAHPHIHVDLGSARSTDMTYTRAADIYVGDASSQVYEFLHGVPKPCLFLAPPNSDWEGNPDYAHWSYGRVCESVAEIMRGLITAEDDLADYRDLQRLGTRAAMGDPDVDAAGLAAQIIAGLLL